MTASVQVIYPATEGSHFDHAYYAGKHMDLVNEHWGPHLVSMLITKGLAGGPDTPPAYHAIASFTFSDETTMSSALEAAGPLLADIPNFTNVAPDMLIGEVTGI